MHDIMVSLSMAESRFTYLTTSIAIEGKNYAGSEHVIVYTTDYCL